MGSSMTKQVVRDVAEVIAREGASALEREAERRRNEACAEVARLRHKLDRLPRWRSLARAITRWQIDRAQDQCAANKASGDAC